MLWYFSDFKRKTFGTLAKSFWLRSLNCILHIERKIFGAFLNLDDPFCHFGTFSKKFWMYFQNCFLCGPEKILFFSKKLNIFQVIRTWSWIFLHFWPQKSTSLAKLQFDVPRGTFREKHCFIKKNFLLFQTFSQTCSENGNFLLRSINCKLRDQRRFFGKFPWSSSSYSIYFGLLAKTNRSVCQNCFLWALRIVLKEKGFFSKNFFPCFSDLDQTFPGFLAKIFW